MTCTKVLFVLTRPSTRRAYDAVWRRFGHFQSLAVPLLAALTPQGIDVEILHQDDPRVLTTDADIVALSFMTSHATEAYRLCDELRRRGKTVVVGGIHPSAVPQEASAHADVVAVGAGERLWPRILNDFIHERLHLTYADHDSVSLLHLPVPRHELVQHAKRWIAPLQTTRGCPFNCEFCSITGIFGRKYRTRNVAEVIHEVEATDASLYVMVDDNIAVDRKFAADLFRGLAPLRKPWFSQCDISIGDDDELLSLASESGCVALLFGLESISQADLASVGKGMFLADHYQRLLRNVQRHGIMTIGSFIVGLDGQTSAVFDKTVTFARKAGLAYAYMPILTPYPGTRLRARLQQSNRLLMADWSKYDGTNVLFEPIGMTADDLSSGWKWATVEIATLSSIYDRLSVAPVQLRYNLPFNLGYYIQTRFSKYWRKVRGTHVNGNPALRSECQPAD